MQNYHSIDEFLLLHIIFDNFNNSVRHFHFDIYSSSFSQFQHFRCLTNYSFH